MKDISITTTFPTGNDLSAFSVYCAKSESHFIQIVLEGDWFAIMRSCFISDGTVSMAEMENSLTIIDENIFSQNGMQPNYMCVIDRLKLVKNILNNIIDK